jgi:hypothetical protein
MEQPNNPQYPEVSNLKIKLMYYIFISIYNLNNLSAVFNQNAQENIEENKQLLISLVKVWEEQKFKILEIIATTTGLYLTNPQAYYFLSTYVYYDIKNIHFVPVAVSEPRYYISSSLALDDPIYPKDQSSFSEKISDQKMLCTFMKYATNSESYLNINYQYLVTSSVETKKIEGSANILFIPYLSEAELSDKTSHINRDEHLIFLQSVSIFNPKLNQTKIYNVYFVNKEQSPNV